jgi:hypothetical protein
MPCRRAGDTAYVIGWFGDEPPGDRSVGAGGLPEVDAALDGVLVDRVELLLREVEVVERSLTAHK